MPSLEQRSEIKIVDRRNDGDQGQPGINIEVGSLNTIVINGEKRIKVGGQCVLNREIVTLKEVQFGRAIVENGRGEEITVPASKYNDLSVASSIATV